MRKDGIDTFEDVAPRLATNGYAPLPIQLREKRPLPREWQNYIFRPSDARAFMLAGTGILTAKNPAADIDIRDEALARELEKLAIETLGPAPRRIGQPPKVLLVYRTDRPFNKLSTRGYRLPGDSPDDKAHRVEFLANGQQFVAYNVHVTTGQPYQWNGKGDPLSVPASALATITEAQAREYIRRCDEILARHGTPVGRLAAQREANLRDASRPEQLAAHDMAECREAIAAIPNENLEYDDWISVIYAIKGALGEQGLADALHWSAKSEKDRPEETRRAYAAARPTSIGAGTLYFWAREAGWKPKPSEPATGDPIERLRVEILSDIQAGPEAIDAAKPPQFVVAPYLPVAGASIAAPGGTGKTTVVMNEMVRIASGCALYGFPVKNPGTCILVTAEDGADYGRYVLQQILADGIASGHLSQKPADIAKREVRIIGWRSSIYGPIVKADKEGNLSRTPVYDLLMQLIAPLNPVYVTFDPAVLFGAGERYSNDGDAFLAAMLHDTALAMGACVQLVDHVAKVIVREGIVDQYAARGGSAKTDNARLARQLTSVTDKDANGRDTLLPTGVTPEDIKTHRLLRLHTTKSNYAPIGEPLWLLRHKFWIEYLPTPTADEVRARRHTEQEERTVADVECLVAHIRQQLSLGVKLSTRDLDTTRPLLPDDKTMPRWRTRLALQKAMIEGQLGYRKFPKEERHAKRKEFIAPAEYPPDPPEPPEEDAQAAQDPEATKKKQDVSTPLKSSR